MSFLSHCHLALVDVRILLQALMNFQCRVQRTATLQSCLSRGNSLPHCTRSKVDLRGLMVDNLQGVNEFLLIRYEQNDCSSRNCQNYDDTQMYVIFFSLDDSHFPAFQLDTKVRSSKTWKRHLLLVGGTTTQPSLFSDSRHTLLLSTTTMMAGDIISLIKSANRASFLCNHRHNDIALARLTTYVIPLPAVLPSVG